MTFSMYRSIAFGIILTPNETRLKRRTTAQTSKKPLWNKAHSKAIVNLRKCSWPWVSATSVAVFLCVGGCTNGKSASEVIKNRPAAARTATPSVGLGQRTVRRDNTHTVPAARPIFLIFARANNGDLVSGTCFYLGRPRGRWIITANHVIADADPNNILARVGTARLSSGSFTGSCFRLSRSASIANDSNAPLILRDTSPHRGEVVTFTGFPIPDLLGASSAATVQGPVVDDTSTVGGIADFKIAAPATGGDSGAPVLDAEGSVVGVVVYATGDRQSALQLRVSTFSSCWERLDMNKTVSIKTLLTILLTLGFTASSTFAFIYYQRAAANKLRAEALNRSLNDTNAQLNKSRSQLTNALGELKQTTGQLSRAQAESQHRLSLIFAQEDNVKVLKSCLTGVAADDT